MPLRCTLCVERSSWEKSLGQIERANADGRSGGRREQLCRGSEAPTCGFVAGKLTGFSERRGSMGDLWSLLDLLVNSGKPGHKDVPLPLLRKS